MPAAVRTDSVREALRPYLGSAMVDGTDVAEQAAQALRTYAPYRDELEDVAERVRRALFDCLYGALGPPHGRAVGRRTDASNPHAGLA